jgi:Zn finger protein HypA/HybF involved in hydrogenase expression
MFAAELVPVYISNADLRCPECTAAYDARDRYCPRCHSATPAYRYG